jgi:hypothetical protein
LCLSLKNIRHQRRTSFPSSDIDHRHWQLYLSRRRQWRRAAPGLPLSVTLACEQALSVADTRYEMTFSCSCVYLAVLRAHRDSWRTPAARSSLSSRLLTSIFPPFLGYFRSALFYFPIILSDAVSGCAFVSLYHSMCTLADERTLPVAGTRYEMTFSRSLASI